MRRIWGGLFSVFLVGVIGCGLGPPLEKTGRITSVEEDEVCLLFSNGSTPYCFDPARADEPIDVEVGDCVETKHARESTRVLSAEVVSCDGVDAIGESGPDAEPSLSAGYGRVALGEDREFGVLECDVEPRDLGNPLLEGLEDLVEQSPAAQQLAGGITQLFFLAGEGTSPDGVTFSVEVSRALDPLGLLVEQVRVWEGRSADPVVAWDLVGQVHVDGDVSPEGPILTIEGGRVDGAGGFAESHGFDDAEAVIEGSVSAVCP